VFTWAICASIAGFILLDHVVYLIIGGGLLLALVFFGITLCSPFAGLAIWVLIAPLLDSFFRLRFGGQGSAVVSADRLCLILLIGVFFLLLKRGSRSEGVSFLHICMGAFVVSFFIASTPSVEPWLAVRKILASYTLPIFGYFIARKWVTGPRQLAIIFICIMIVSCYFAAMGIPEHYMKRTLFRPTIWVEHELETVRVQGPAQTPQEFGVVVAMGILLAVVGWANTSRRNAKFLYAVLVAILMMAIVLTLRRSVYLSAVAGLPILLLGSREVRKLAIYGIASGALVLLVVWPLITQTRVYQVRLTDPQPVYSRQVLQASSWNMIKDNAFRGVGVDNFGTSLKQYLTPYGNVPVFYARDLVSPHNSYLRILAEGGLLSFMPFVLMVLAMLQVTYRIYKRHPERGILGRDGVVVFWGLTAAILLQASSTDSLDYARYLNTMWYVVLGTLVGAHLKLPEQAPEKMRSVQRLPSANRISRPVTSETGG